MRKWAKGAAGATLLTASFVAFGAGPALADVTNGNDSIGGGNQINAPISIPVNACGNGIAVIGHALAGCRGGATVRGGGYAGGGHYTSGAHSVLGGNQVHAPISAPINACGNSVAVIGHALAGCRGGAAVRGGGGAFGGRTSGRDSIGGGNQVHAPVNAPVDVCGNAIGNALAGCEGGAGVYGGPGGYAGGGHYTSGAHSVLGGNQVHAPVTAPIDVCGNAAAVIGQALAGCKGSATTGYPGGFHGRTSGRDSIGGGNQVHAPVNAPVDVCGNAAAVIGRAVGGCEGSSGYGDDCVYPSSARMSGLPQLPVDPASLRTGAMPVARGATPALPTLPVGGMAQQAAPNPLGGGLGLPPVGDPPKQLPPIGLAAAKSAPSQHGTLLALALGGALAASAGTVSMVRRLRRR